MFSRATRGKMAARLERNESRRTTYAPTGSRHRRVAGAGGGRPVEKTQRCSSGRVLAGGGARRGGSPSCARQADVEELLTLAPTGGILILKHPPSCFRFFVALAQTPPGCGRPPPKSRLRLITSQRGSPGGLPPSISVPLCIVHSRPIVPCWTRSLLLVPRERQVERTCQRQLTTQLHAFDLAETRGWESGWRAGCGEDNAIIRDCSGGIDLLLFDLCALSICAKRHPHTQSSTCKAVQITTSCIG